MTAKEKAKELVDKYLNTIIHFPYIDTENGDCIGTGYMTHQSAIGCALIACDEVLQIFEGLHKPEDCAFDAIGERKYTFDSEYENQMNGYEMVEYWQQVKGEINLL
jgi:hypothetical protein